MHPNKVDRPQADEKPEKCKDSDAHQATSAGTGQHKGCEYKEYGSIKNVRNALDQDRTAVNEEEGRRDVVACRGKVDSQKKVIGVLPWSVGEVITEVSGYRV